MPCFGECQLRRNTSSLHHIKSQDDTAHTVQNTIFHPCGEKNPIHTVDENEEVFLAKSMARSMVGRVTEGREGRVRGVWGGGGGEGVIFIPASYNPLHVALYVACCFICSGNYRLYPFTITVDGQTCASVSFTTSREVDVMCSSIMNGQVVRLTRTSGPDMLNMCEFQVFGKSY